ncbi:MFS transporter [Hyphomonadaceae bacterium BL14]|nr:MFS transporter [Hyphomonadaceae bacterium BL14]
MIFYATDILGLAPETAGAIILAAMLWDAALDPVIGFAADRFHTPFGKYGLYILAGAPLASLFLVLIFLLPAQSPDPAMALLATLFAFKFFYTLIDLPHNALLARVSHDSRERGTIATTRFVFSSLGSLSIAAGAYVIFDGEGGQAARFAAFAAVAGLLSLAAMWTSWISVAQADRAGPAVHPSFADLLRGLAALLSNREARVVLIVCFLSGASIPLFARGLPYFAKYDLGAENLVAPALAVLVLGQALAAPIWNRVSARLEKARALVLAHGLAIAALAIFFLAPSDGGPILWTAILCLGAAGGGMWSLIWAMAPDVVDLVEHESGVRPEAVIIALASDAMKIGLAVGALVFGFLLDAAGYQAGAVQSAGTLLGLKVIMTLPAVIGSGLVAVLLLGYSLSHDTHRRLWA